MSKVGARHLLCKHTGSRNPLSRRTGKAITLSKADALKELNELRDAITSSGDPTAKFIELATSRSDCGSFANGGDLGMFGRGEMQRPFEEATFGLAVGAISGVVDTDSGLHIIYRYK